MTSFCFLQPRPSALASFLFPGFVTPQGVLLTFLSLLNVAKSSLKVWSQLGFDTCLLPSLSTSGRCLGGGEGSLPLSLQSPLPWSLFSLLDCDGGAGRQKVLSLVGWCRHGSCCVMSLLLWPSLAGHGRCPCRLWMDGRVIEKRMTVLAYVWAE